MTGNNERIAYLQFIQDTISVYDKHTLLAKGAAFLVTAGAFAAYGSDIPEGTLALFGLGAAFMLLVLWMFDARYQQYKIAYVNLYDAARKEAEPSFTMDVSPYVTETSFHRALWSTPASWFYIGQIAVVAFLSFMV